jgi:predicted MFS family arabinose efflux permease
LRRGHAALLLLMLEAADTMHSKEAGSVINLLRHHPRAVLIVLAFTMGGSLYFYTFTTYMQKYLVNTAHMDAKIVTFVMTVVLVVYMFLQPAFGALSDRIGRRNNMILFTALGALAAVPLLVALGDVSNPYMAFFLVLIALAIASFYTSISGVVKAELFPTQVRALGVGLTYAVANALFGGTADMASTILDKHIAPHRVQLTELFERLRSAALAVIAQELEASLCPRLGPAANAGRPRPSRWPFRFGKRKKTPLPIHEPFGGELQTGVARIGRQES